MADEIRQSIIVDLDSSKVKSDLQRLEGEFKSGFANIQNIGKTALSTLGAGISLAGITSAGKAILDLADNLQNLSEQTGVSVELLSGIKSPLEEAGTSIDAFAKGVFNLQKNLGNVDKDTDPAAQAIKRLGLNLNDLRNANPDEFIKKVTDALGKIENPVERNTVLFNLLGKSAKELGPALGALAGKFDELKRSGLSAADVKAIDDVGDAITRLKNKLLAFGAVSLSGIFRGIGLAARSAEDIRRDLDNTFKFAPGDLGKIGSLQKELNAAIGRESLDASKQSALFKGFGGSSTEVNKLEQALNSFRESMRKTIETQETQIAQFRFGEEAAAEVAQAFKTLELQEKLIADKVPIPPSVAQAAREATETLKAFRVDVAGLAETDLIKLQETAAQAAISVDILKDSFKEAGKFAQAFADAANEGFQEKITTPAQAAAELAAKQRLDEISLRAQLGAIDTSTPEGAERKRLAEITVEFAKTAAEIDKLGKQIGLSEEEIATRVAEVWKGSLNDIGHHADETSIFIARAMERGFDAASDALKDFLDNGATSFGDFAEKVRKSINSIAADFITLQTKTALFGENFGKSGAGGTSVGGLLGSFFGSSGGGSGGSFGFGSAPAGVEGPAFANGGFFSSALGALTSFFGFHAGGAITRDGRYASFTRALPRFHGGGEVPIMAQEGEFMVRRPSAKMLGRSTLDYINQTGRLPSSAVTAASASRAPVFNVSFNGVQDMDSFKRSRSTLMADLARATRKSGVYS